MADNNKDTIYIDIDDEITTIIEKVRSSHDKIVALVLPKRATVLQSIVNMKLLKRTAEAAKKHIVLITSEAGLLPLAGSVGLYVAKNLQTKPEIPAAPGEAETTDDLTAVPLDGDDEDITAGNRPIGELAGGTAAVVADDDAIETLDLDNEAPEADAAASPDAAPKDKPKKPKGDKKLAVPNFNKFRLRLALGALALVLLIIFWILASGVLPKATVTISTDTSNINSNLTLNLDTKATALDPSGPTLPATLKTLQKTQTQQVPTTGQQNNGQKATGSVTMTTCRSDFNYPADVPAGTGLSTNGITFITQEAAQFVAIGPNSGHTCFQFKSSGSIDMVAQQGGTKYNVNGADLTVAGRSDVSATGSASGGTDDIIQVVSQADIDSAKSKIAAQDNNTVKGQLKDQLEQADLYAIPVTFNAGTPTVTNSSNVGDQASTVTVTENITYTMFGVKEKDLKTLVDNDVKDQIDPSKQSVLSEGLSHASFKLIASNDTSAQLGMTTTATAGPDLKADAIKKQIAGMKSGEVITTLKSDPGVTDVRVHFSPFWVSKVPPKASKITINFEKAH